MRERVMRAWKIVKQACALLPGRGVRASELCLLSIETYPLVEVILSKRRLSLRLLQPMIPQNSDVNHSLGHLIHRLNPLGRVVVRGVLRDREEGGRRATTYLDDCRTSGEGIESTPRSFCEQRGPTK